MKTVGIIAEYNPFHKGHKYHLEETMKLTGAEASVALMSGNFVQRGEPAIINKWARAEAAVKSGIDLVIELPSVYAVNNAEFFAMGGVSLLEGLGCDYISFGSETGDISMLKRAALAAKEETQEYKGILRTALDAGLSYPKAREKAITETTGVPAEVLKNPNNILAIEYLRFMEKAEPVAIMREGAGYRDNELKKDEFSSATAIRSELYSGTDKTADELGLENQVLEIINSNVKLELNDFYKTISYTIMRSSDEDLSRILAVSEGLEHRLKDAASKSSDVTSLIKNTISKRYTETRIKRILIQMLLGITKDDLRMIKRERPLYARVLAFSETGAKLLKEIKNDDSLTLPVITNVNREKVNTPAEERLLRIDMLASDIYNLAAGNDIYSFSDHVKRPYIK